MFNPLLISVLENTAFVSIRKKLYGAVSGEYGTALV